MLLSPERALHPAVPWEEESPSQKSPIAQPGICMVHPCRSNPTTFHMKEMLPRTAHWDSSYLAVLPARCWL